MHTLVQGYTDAVLETPGRDAGRIAGELAAFVNLLDFSTDLRGVLDSDATPDPARRSIIRELLANRVSAPVLDLLSFAVQSGPGAQRRRLRRGRNSRRGGRQEGRHGGPRRGPLGWTAATQRVDGFASAVLAPVPAGRLGDIEDELFRFMRVVEGNDELCCALTTPELPASARQSVVTDLLTGRAAESTRLASYAARIGRPRDYVLLLSGLVDRVAKEANQRVADVRSATEMTQPQRLRLAAVLTKLTGHPVDVRLTTQPDLLGGFVAAVGDTVVDASLRHRLEQARGFLLAPPRGDEPDAATSPGLDEH